MKKRLFILSPHLDDAVISCTEHIVLWKKNYIVTIVTIFDRFSGGCLPQYSRAILKKYFCTPRKYELLRRYEDDQALKKLQVKTIRLHLLDGGFRKTTTGKAMYTQSSSLFSGRVHSQDTLLYEKITRVLSNFISPNDVVVSPLAIGKHADHIITRTVAEKMIKPSNLWFYVDFPYALKMENTQSIPWLKLLQHAFSIRLTSGFKKNAIRTYASQAPLLFPTRIPSFPEIILHKKFW